MTSTLLEGVFDVFMNKETKLILKTVRSHRNNMVHYFHHNLNDQKRAESLTVEQATAWFRLNGFLKSNSKKLRIEKYQYRLDNLEKQLISYSQYAEQKLESLKPKIEGLKITGEVFELCSNCDQVAMQVSKGDVFLNCLCLVCNSTDIRLQVKCPECKTDQVLYNPSVFECKNCEHVVSQDSKLFDLLDETRPNYDPDNNKPNETPANCMECESHESVCLHKGKYLCIYCWKVSPELYRCGFCDEPMNIDIDDSHFFGCLFCEGYMSHMMSKD